MSRHITREMKDIVDDYVDLEHLRKRGYLSKNVCECCGREHSPFLPVWRHPSGRMLCGDRFCESGDPRDEKKA